MKRPRACVSWRSCGGHLYRDTEVPQALEQPLGHAILVSLLKMVRTEVMILDAIAEHDRPQ